MIALHCSGGSGRQWQALGERLAGRFAVSAPDFYGTPSRPHWSGARPFRLADEAAAVLEFIDAASGPVHLVGHSYGAALALHLAVARPRRVASLSLYEPTAFHVLRAMGPDGRVQLLGMRKVALEIERAVLDGAPARAAERFVDYWNGAGTWTAMPAERQLPVLLYMPKASLDFDALFAEPTPLQAYARLRIPLLLMLGEHAPAPTRCIVRKLTAVMQPADVVIVPGAGHMGPLTHAGAVAAAVVRHLDRVEPLSAAQARPTPVPDAA